MKQPEICALCVAVFAIAFQQLGTVISLLAPLDELHQAFIVLERISQRAGDPGSMRARTIELLLVTAHTQIALGYMGIGYLKKAQLRQNDLLAVQPGSANNP